MIFNPFWLSGIHKSKHLAVNPFSIESSYLKTEEFKHVANFKKVENFILGLVI
jgi:hypothetical protein